MLRSVSAILIGVFLISASNSFGETQDMSVFLEDVTCNDNGGQITIRPYRLISSDELALGLRVFPGRYGSIEARDSKGEVVAKGVIAPSELTKNIRVVNDSECVKLKDEFKTLSEATKRCGNPIRIKLVYEQSANSAHSFQEPQAVHHTCL